NKEEPKMISGDFGLCDLNIGYFLPAIETGWEIIGLPVFSKRKPVYQLIFCHADAGIRTPKDLEGKRIGSRTYRTALTVWARGLLRDRYGVDFANVQWVLQAKEVFPVHDKKAKQIAYDDILSDRNGFSVVYLRERMKEQLAAWSDPWKYGIKANKTTLDAFIKYNVEQGMIRSAPTYAEIFASGTLDT